MCEWEPTELDLNGLVGRLIDIGPYDEPSIFHTKDDTAPSQVDQNTEDEESAGENKPMNEEPREEYIEEEDLGDEPPVEYEPEENPMEEDDPEEDPEGGPHIGGGPGGRP